ncbi:MAG: RHS repeat-associated core domain-containing protein [Clostridia bacterium]|nr:RHS repeat-associated core domain-containing protein [Clostridia bacterium]
MYDAWGNILAITDGNGTDVSNVADHIANVNPIRYRSYYYDRETNLYYLESRYYDPETGRFLNADNLGYMEPGTVAGLNLYAYCLNNPVVRYDPTGKIAWWGIVLIVVVAVATLAADHALAKHAPEGVAIYDDHGKDVFHDQFVYANGSGASANKEGITLADIEVGVYKGISKTAFGDISVTTFGTAEAKAKMNYTSILASAYISAYTMSYSNTLNIFGHDVHISGNLYYGYAGAGAEFNLESKKFKIAPPMVGIGFDFGIEID